MSTSSVSLCGTDPGRIVGCDALKSRAKALLGRGESSKVLRNGLSSSGGGEKDQTCD